MFDIARTKKIEYVVRLDQAAEAQVVNQIFQR